MFIPPFQDTLLEQLGVSPVTTSTTDPWPMTVCPRALAILAQVLLLRQQRERHEGGGGVKGQSEAAVMGIWMRFMTTLTQAAIHVDGCAKDLEGELKIHLGSW